MALRRFSGMFKVLALIVGGIFLMTFGIYFLSIASLPAFAFPVLQLPVINVNWTIVGFVAIAGSIATLGSAFIVSRLG